MAHIVDKFVTVYNDMQYDTVYRINDIYEPHIVFVDPFHEIHGLQPLAEYFAEMYENVAHCQFRFNEQYTKEKSAALFWTMTLRHKTFDKHNTIEINGSSLIRFGDKIHFHQDYFDAGALIYERVPLVGKVIKTIKARV
ncbi:MAG: hypothetical protein AMJ53_03190 [Gammaproteobacteria bacterium SG8_11]|nr:MAG: hypothetical protein AMJ53_03190 [Gammaproteobacteria bacterium SG8_11]